MIYHCYSDYESSSQDIIRKMDVAKRTWSVQPWIEVSVKNSDLTRLFKEEGRIIPYLKDILNLAFNLSGPEDIIVYTNADICVRSNLCQIIDEALKLVRNVYAHRREFTGPLLDPIPDETIQTGLIFCGLDLIAFKKSWWKEFAFEFPDVLIATEAWDFCMKILMDRTNPDHVILDENAIYHEMHIAYNTRPENRLTLPSQKHNLRLTYDYMKANGMIPECNGIPFIPNDDNCHTHDSVVI